MWLTKYPVKVNNIAVITISLAGYGIFHNIKRALNDTNIVSLRAFIKLCIGLLL